MTDLPIEHIIPALRNTLGSYKGAVLQAPPGAGKTTRVPLALLDEPWLGGRRIVMLEPRRLAARAAAARMASTLDERIGESVGYRMRMDTRVGPSTRIEVVTEGVLTRMLQSDPGLEGTGLVIFDEFHERSLQGDLGLALALQAQSLLREDIRILVMSATLDGEAIASLLDGVPIITSEGKSYPVETRYLERSPGSHVEPAVIAAIHRAVSTEEGDILVFLPGAGEIRRVAKMLEERGTQQHVTIAPLYGNLPQEAQDLAIASGRSGQRNVVLSTSIAETSLTIEGIRVVIDSGLMRVPRFSAGSGMTRLETTRVSRASADQRRGRAGRLGPGVCYRLWREAEDAELLAYTPPEILEADLVPLALDLAEWGISDPLELRWIDPPPSGTFAGARDLLSRLGALDAAGTITPHGRRMAALPLHPRLAHMLLRGQSLGSGGLACDLAALLAERDIFRSTGSTIDADLRLRLEALRSPGRGDTPATEHAHGYQIDRAAYQRVLKESQMWRNRLGIARNDRAAIDGAGLLLALAYPDRIAQMRSGQPDRFLLRNGRGGFFSEPQLLSESPYLAIADLDGRQRESRIYRAAALELSEIEEHFSDQIVREDLVEWDGGTGSVKARARERLGALTLREISLRDPDPEKVAAALMCGIEEEGLQILPWNKGTRQLQERIVFMHGIDPDWPDLSDEVLLANLQEWLGPYLSAMKRRDDLRSLDIHTILLGMLEWEQRRGLDEVAPTHLTVPSGSHIPIDYSNPEGPTLSVRLQEMFGLSETPRIARGRVPLTIHLLSPANRPVQVTRDLANFWRSTYFEVRKDLKGRYPKHYWPDDPMQAEPTRRAKPRGT